MTRLIEEARKEGARLSRICAVLEISPRAFQRHGKKKAGGEDGRKAAQTKRAPANGLTCEEEAMIVSTVNEPRFASMSPAQIVPILADEEQYLASESTLYRILRKRGQLAHRGRSKAPTHKRPSPLEATAPNQVWTWDITYLSTTVKGHFFYLYLILDLYSRKVVGWEVYAEESSGHAAETIRKTVFRERKGGIAPKVVLHSDNGAPMKGATMLGTLQMLGIRPSFGRPSVSNDNAYSESLFKTLKYRPDDPVEKPFDTLEEGRKWVSSFTGWYNEEHRHSAIKFVTPSQRHRGEDREILTRRDRTYQEAQKKNPERWSGKTRDWTPIEKVTLNPQKEVVRKDQNLKEEKSKKMRQIV